MSQIDVMCPYCNKPTAVEWPDDFAGRYAKCYHCDEKFIYERSGNGCKTWTLSEAPCCSDPECKETEMSLGDD